MGEDFLVVEAQAGLGILVGGRQAGDVAVCFLGPDGGGGFDGHVRRYVGLFGGGGGGADAVVVVVVVVIVVAVLVLLFCSRSIAVVVVSSPSAPAPAPAPPLPPPACGCGVEALLLSWVARREREASLRA